AVAHTGLKELTFSLAGHVRLARAEQLVEQPARVVVRPRAVDDSGFTVRRENTADGEVFRVLGDRPTRWVRQTDFTNDEAVGFLADRLNRLGVEDELLALGAQAGDDVVIGAEDDAVVFDFDPTITAGAEVLGPRGEDLRLERSARRTNRERRELLAARRAWELEAAAARAEGREPEPFVWDPDEEYDGDDAVGGPQVFEIDELDDQERQDEEESR